ncbi:histidine phosphatase family protein [Janthinobacterium sp. 17J80-10]|uniref:histidine phosphatase family protein n=1 Tax=Janthinobacterium sp. 17J80-10 TaxID=2497863 RepID=UPI001005894A|nr:histidine phosphatase family protein [Janthinobacterium sp. 17J80-10]QAU34139.1 histidine phosphatase family protein [Janthinobacterium sp. 17J80-10]
MPAAPRRRRLYLVRHGHVSYFDADGRPLHPVHVALSPQGVSQVESLAAALNDVRVDRVVCSDLERARQTAQILAERMAPKLVPEPNPGLREIRAGRLREIVAEQREARLAYAYDHAADDNADFIGGERFADFERRILDALEALLADPDWDSALVVSHDAVNRVLLCWAAGVGRHAMVAFEQDMACLNIIDVDWADARVVRRLIRTVNFTAYDAVKARASLTVMEQVFRAYRSDDK